MSIKIGKIEIVEIDKLTPNPKNRNIHPQDQIDELARHYGVHGMRTPIIVSNQSGYIVAGNGRYLAAIKAGLKELPVSYQDFDSPEKEYAFGIADNGLGGWSELDLSSINMDIVDLGPDFDIQDLGIKDFSLDPSELELPNSKVDEPGFQQVTFVLSNEQKDILDEAMAKAKKEEDCSDELNQNPNGNILIAILKRYVYS